ncbi:MAG: hypothetical protein NTV54_14045 [Ignavibacteriales bacterium]|nr:hypothetical protein [Ignavibacteriales bacterium]
MIDPYAAKLVNRSFYAAKVDIVATIVVVLSGMLENRSLQLIAPISRAFPKGTILELIGTDEETAAPGTSVNAIVYLGFVELQSGGILLAGDEVCWNGKVIGTLAGYDDTHMPNHQNTIVQMAKRISGKDLGFALRDEITIKGISLSTSI